MSRSLPLAGLAARTAVSRLVDLLPGADGAAASARTAARYAEVLGDMKGALMKAGQILSFVDDAGLVPPEYRPMWEAALGSLQADASPMDAATAAGVVQAELGAPPEEVFDWFAPMPFAAASIGQVHAARLGDAELAVKVQYPGVAEAIKADLGNTDLFAAFIRLGQRALGDRAPDIDVEAVVDEVRDRIGEELDYRVERANQEDFAALYRGDPSIRVPATVERLTTARVLTMEMIDGRRWAAALESPQELRDRWGEVIVRFVYGSLWRHGLFNADPHPGNYLFHEDGGVTFLDFGCVKRFPPGLVEAMKASERAVLDGDPDGLVAAFTDLGLLPPDTGVRGDRLLQWFRPSYEPLLADQPYTYTREYAAEVVRRHFDPFGPWGDITRRITVPRDVVFLNRIVIGLNSVLGMLGATADWRAIADELREA